MSAEVDEDLGTVRWFGASWHAPVCDPRSHIATPSGMSCTRCDIAIDDEDQGVTIPTMARPGLPWKATRAAWHLECWLAEVVGSVAARDLITHNPGITS